MSLAHFRRHGLLADAQLRELTERTTRIYLKSFDNILFHDNFRPFAFTKIQVVQCCQCCRQYFKDLMSSGCCSLLTMRRNNILQANSSLFIPVQKLFGISGIHAHLVHFRSPPFKGSLDVRPGDLCTYVLTP